MTNALGYNVGFCDISFIHYNYGEDIYNTLLRSKGSHYTDLDLSLFHGIFHPNIFFIHFFEIKPLYV